MAVRVGVGKLASGLKSRAAKRAGRQVAGKVMKKVSPSLQDAVKKLKKTMAEDGKSAGQIKKAVIALIKRHKVTAAGAAGAAAGSAMSKKEKK